jgi:hypothetical protein
VEGGRRRRDGDGLPHHLLCRNEVLYIYHARKKPPVLGQEMIPHLTLQRRTDFFLKRVFLLDEEFAM